MERGSNNRRLSIRAQKEAKDDEENEQEKKVNEEEKLEEKLEEKPEKEEPEGKNENEIAGDQVEEKEKLGEENDKEKYGHHDKLTSMDRLSEEYLSNLNLSPRRRNRITSPRLQEHQARKPAVHPIQLNRENNNDTNENTNNRMMDEDVSGISSRPNSPRFLDLKPSDKRMRIIQELLQTEETYVKKLGILINEIKIPLSNLSKSKKPMIQFSEIQSIFSVIEIIYNINAMLLNDLSARSNDWSPEQQIGDIFLYICPQFKVCLLLY